LSAPHPFSREREFGLVVGGILAALGAWWLHRGKFGPVAHSALVAGAALALFGAVAPGLLVLPRRGWMALAEALSWVMTRVILFAVFFFVVTPIGLVRRLSGADPLGRRSAPRGSSWHAYPPRHLDPKHVEKAF
jgi:hypothetical protein